MIESQDETTRKCRVCEKRQPIEFFYKNGYNRPGTQVERRTVCKICDKERRDLRRCGMKLDADDAPAYPPMPYAHPGDEFYEYERWLQRKAWELKNKGSNRQGITRCLERAVRIRLNKTKIHGYGESCLGEIPSNSKDKANQRNLVANQKAWELWEKYSVYSPQELREMDFDVVPGWPPNQFVEIYSVDERTDDAI